MRRHFFLATTVLFATALCVATGELLVRFSGHEVWRPIHPVSPNLPVIHEPEPELGWRNKPGRFVWPGRLGDAGRDIVMTFWPQGARATAAQQTRRASRVLVLGGSFTQGWAVTNEETYAWKLQQEMPHLEFLNFGTAGYGTYQSLLVLERYLARSPEDVVLIIYGFADFHEKRNVAAGSWLRAISATSRMGPLSVPYATLRKNGSIERHRSESAPDWPFKRQLALMALLEARYSDFRTRARTQQGLAVTDLLVTALDATSRKHGARLLIAVLAPRTGGSPSRYQELFRQRGLESVNCVPPQLGSPSSRIPGYGHPNREVNAYWAACIERRVRAMGIQGVDLASATVTGRENGPADLMFGSAAQVRSGPER